MVDDDRAVRESLRRSLSFNGYTVDLAEDGVEALEAITNERPDAVVLDVMMPRMDGLEVCRQLRSTGDDLPILVLTARDTAALEAMALQTQDLADAFSGDGAQWTSLRIDGGMSVNDWMAQDMADILALPVERPDFVETTALGAAMLAGYGAGLFGSLQDAAGAMRGATRTFAPQMDTAERQARIDSWKNALAAV